MCSSDVLRPGAARAPCAAGMSASATATATSTAATVPSTPSTPAPSVRSRPTNTLAPTTLAENSAWARFIAGRPPASACAASALIATSTAPDVAPSSSSAPASAGAEVASAGSTAVAANASDDERHDPRAGAVDQHAGRAHRGQRPGADAQQRQAERGVARVRVRLHERQRCAPGAPEQPEAGEAEKRAPPHGAECGAGERQLRLGKEVGEPARRPDSGGFVEPSWIGVARRQ